MKVPSSMATKVEKSLVGIAGEYAVASELCRRGVYAQLTLGNRKKVDLLLDGEKGFARVEVKTKQGAQWPSVKGIAPEDGPRFLVLVDLQGKGSDDRPDFYVISQSDWRPFLQRKLKDKITRKTARIDDHDVPHHSDGWVGVGLTANEVARFKNK